MQEQNIFECEEENIDTNQKTISLEEFDNYVENYSKITHRDITPQLYYEQFKMCFNGNGCDFVKLLRYFRKNSRHFHNKQLDLI